jgi:tryptophan 2,3-dioxygenase
MANSIIASQNTQEQEQEIWISLRKAIAKSSGFQSWQRERDINIDGDLDTQVRRYLEETLETLAY